MSARPQPDAAILVEGLVREFPGGVRAVDGIDLVVGWGEIYGFLGPNGAGKSTTVSILTTLLPPTGGRALVGGYDVLKEGPAVRRLIGASLQRCALDPYLTAWEHIVLQGTLHGLSRRESLERGGELLHRLGLGEAAERKVRTYSGGMQRRLDLALALLHRPRLLFLDEPTTGLDVQSRTALWEEIRALANGGVTVFLTTQYLEEADALADRVGIIDRGRLVAEGSPAELKAQIGRPALEAIPAKRALRSRLLELLRNFGEPVELGDGEGVTIRLERGTAELAEVVRAVDGAGIEVADLRIHAPTLDDVFLAKTGRRLEGSKEEG